MEALRNGILFNRFAEIQLWQLCIHCAIVPYSLKLFWPNSQEWIAIEPVLPIALHAEARTLLHRALSPR